MADGAIAFDGTPASFLGWALAAAPELATPGARLLSRLRLPAGGRRPARRARSIREAGLEPSGPAPEPVIHEAGRRRAAAATARRSRCAASGTRSAADPRSSVVSTSRIGPGERVALMGRNGAGKSTLLRHAAGLMRADPGSGRCGRPGRAAAPEPGRLPVHDTVAAEAPPGALARFGLAGAGSSGRHPRELSGGERQRLALAVVLGDGAAPAVLALDEPTRGMDRADRLALAALLRRDPRPR